MNRKNMFLGYGFILVLAMLCKISFAQKTSFQYTSPNFNVGLPSLKSMNRNQINPFPYYTLFLETGNGRYVKDSSHIYDNGEPFTYPVGYNYNIPSGSLGVLNIVGHYDTMKPPKGMLVATGISNTVTLEPPAQNRLPAGKSIGYDYSDPYVVIDRYLTFVIHYKRDNDGQYMVAFFYNDNEPSLQGAKAFADITDPNMTYPVSQVVGNITTPYDLKAVRTKMETAYTSINDLPLQVRHGVQTLQGSFNKAVYFITKLSSKIAERNIFISLATPNDIGLVGSSANVKLALIKYNDNGIDGTPEVVGYTFPIEQLASDPNGIKTFPDCINATHPGAEPFSKPVQYEVNFQNDGPGVATSVEATVTIPRGIDLSVSGPGPITSIVGGKTIPFTKKTTGGIIKSGATYEIVSNGGLKQIIFRLPGIKLPGTKEERRNSSKRHGNIKFTLYSIPKKNKEFPPLTEVPSCMYSDVSIRFFSMREGRETEVDRKTGSCLLRSKCNGIIPAPPCNRAL